MAESIGVAIVGCGWAGTRHARAFTQCGARVAWAVDLDPARAGALAAAVGGSPRTSTDYLDALADPEVQAVAVCLPHYLHTGVSVAAARAGKHVLCEKPIAASLQGADQMIEAADGAGVVLMVAENERFSPRNHKVADLVRAGAIGRVALLQMTRQCYLTRSFLEDRRWFLDARAAAGGIMMSGGVHDFEAARMIVGEVETVYALRASQRFLEMEGDDTSVALVRFQGGAVGTLVESFLMKDLATASGPEVHTLRVDGELGSIAVDDGQTVRLFSEREDLRLGEGIMAHQIHVPPADTFALEVAHFLDCIRTGEEPLTSGRSQRRALEIVLAAYWSMESGRPVTLAQPAGG